MSKVSEKSSLIVHSQHHAIYISYPTVHCGPTPNASGTLIHAKYDEEACTWKLEILPVRDLASFRSLALLWRIATLQEDNIEARFDQLKKLLKSVPFQLRPSSEYRGKHQSRVYDCIIWTTDALKMLLKEGFISGPERKIG